MSMSAEAAAAVPLGKKIATTQPFWVVYDTI